MGRHFKEVKPELVKENVFSAIGNDWMLITAGDINSFNTMTASWGGFGVLWNMNICICFVRHSRYTYNFMENSSFFTLSFFEEKYREALKYCGNHSGRDVDKIKETGLSPVEEESGCIYFEEARTVILARKIYYNDMFRENFLDDRIQEHYPDNDYHRMYIGDILRYYEKE